jgi:hypothetical protein
MGDTSAILAESGNELRAGNLVWLIAEARLTGQKSEEEMAKRHDRPSAQYRYEHYDPHVS